MVRPRARPVLLAHPQELTPRRIGAGGPAAIPRDPLSGEHGYDLGRLTLPGMPQRTIHYRILPDGRVEQQVEGVAGTACEQLTERIEARLGRVQQRRLTAEAYQHASTDTEIRQVLVHPPSS